MLRLRGVRKGYRLRGGGRREVLRGLDAEFRHGEAVGILGLNGAGKTTLLRLIGGVEHPDGGRVERGMSVSWPLGFGGALHYAVTAADNVRFIARLYGKPAGPMMDYVESFAELGEYFRQPVQTYSAGMVTRLGFALSLAVEFDCYLVDEVVAVGDVRFAERCRQALLERRERSTLLLVSHAPEIVRSYCTSGAILRDGGLTRYEDLDEAIAIYQAG